MTSEHVSRTRRLGAIGAVAALALWACAASRPPTVATTPTRTAPSPAPQAAYLVWTRDDAADGGAPRAQTHSVDRDGQRLETRDGIIIATSAGEWRWEVQERVVATSPCEDMGADGAPREGRVTDALLRQRGAHQVVVRGLDRSGANELTHGVHLLGSLGPFLFVEQSTYEYACGAHGGVSFGFLVWNVEHGRAEPVLGSIDTATLMPRARKVVAARADPLAGEPELVALRPKITAGALTFEAQLAHGTCYACGDGAWSSYTASLFLPVTAPAALSRWATLPSAVSRFAGAHRTLKIGGFSASVAP